MFDPRVLRKPIILFKYFQLHYSEIERWISTHNPSDWPPPERLRIHDLEPSDLQFGADDQDDMLPNTEVAAFLAGLTLREAGLQYRAPLVTTANYVVLKAKLEGIGLDNLDNVEFIIDAENSPPLISLSGPDGTVSASIVIRADSLFEPWDGTFIRSESEESRCQHADGR